jgi:hypothetical protein
MPQLRAGSVVNASEPPVEAMSFEVMCPAIIRRTSWEGGVTCGVPVSHWVALLKKEAPTERVSARGQPARQPLASLRGAGGPLAGGWGWAQDHPRPGRSTEYRARIIFIWVDAYASGQGVSVRSVCCTPIFVIPLLLRISTNERFRLLQTANWQWEEKKKPETALVLPCLALPCPLIHPRRWTGGWRPGVGPHGTPHLATHSPPCIPNLRGVNALRFQIARDSSTAISTFQPTPPPATPSLDGGAAAATTTAATPTAGGTAATKAHAASGSADGAPVEPEHQRATAAPNTVLARF